MRGLGLLLVLAGCNQLFGLEPSELIDSNVIDPNHPDAFRPVLPPDGSTQCNGAPAFETWSYGARTIPFSMQVGTFGLYASSGATHMIVTPVDGSGIWDVDLAGSATQISNLVPPPAKNILSVAVSPDGAAIWFKIEQATYVALRATGYERQLTELGVPNANEVIPGAPGFYDGTLRMVVRLREGTTNGYVELSSTDGLTWTRGDALPFGGAGFYAAAMSADGCILTYAHQDSGSSFGLYYAYRSTDGTWGASTFKLDAATTAGGSFPINPALAPNLASLWFQAAGQGLFEGHL